MRIALLQHNPKAGDCSGNAAILANLALAAHRPSLEGGEGKTLCLAPASAISGHKAFIRVGGFMDRCTKAAKELAAMVNTPGLAVLIGLPNAEAGEDVWLVSAGHISRVEQSNGVLILPGLRLRMVTDKDVERTLSMSRPDADAVLFWPGEVWIPGCQSQREDFCSALTSRWKLPVMLVQAYGGTDGNVLAGQSAIFAADGALIARAPAFADSVVICYSQREMTATAESAFAITLTDRPANVVGNVVGAAIHPDLSRWEGMFHATVCGIRDYVRKCGLKGVLLGLSGGMDSALVACLATEAMRGALGPNAVLGVLMPSPWSSDHSITDALELAKNLGIRTVTAPIEPMMDAYDDVLAPLFAELPVRHGVILGQTPDLTAENLQPRIRGALLMAFANRMDYLVLATGNKSEAAVGYSTLYGDTVGGIAPIGDIYKTDVYALAQWYNEYKCHAIIPEHVFSKAPSAELRPDQCDQDSLPPYDVLDAILYALLEEGRDPASLLRDGAFEAGMLQDTMRRMAMAEFKRHQVPPVIRLTSCALGADWRLPAAGRMF